VRALNLKRLLLTFCTTSEDQTFIIMCFAILKLFVVVFFLAFASAQAQSTPAEKVRLVTRTRAEFRSVPLHACNHGLSSRLSAFNTTLPFKLNLTKVHHIIMSCYCRSQFNNTDYVFDLDGATAVVGEGGVIGGVLP
jgi:hypothetical protein